MGKFMDLGCHLLHFFSCKYSSLSCTQELWQSSPTDVVCLWSSKKSTWEGNDNKQERHYTHFLCSHTLYGPSAFTSKTQVLRQWWQSITPKEKPSLGKAPQARGACQRIHLVGLMWLRQQGTMDTCVIPVFCSCVCPHCPNRFYLESRSSSVKLGWISAWQEQKQNQGLLNVRHSVIAHIHVPEDQS